MMRHCAFCLTKLELPKICTKCGRRAYCSRECQVSDWTPGCGGQGHKEWCGVPCCEEDVDWEILPAGKKGEGMFAKKKIPRHMRVIVDGARPEDCPYFDALLPKGGTYEQKKVRNGIRVPALILNGVRTVTPPDYSSIYLRASKLNHSCDSNVAPVGNGETGVTVFIALRDIEPGEELTFDYNFRDFLPDYKLNSLAENLMQNKNTHGITHAADCTCRDMKRWRALVKADQDFKQIQKLQKAGKKHEAFELIIEHFDLFKSLKCAPASECQYLIMLLALVGLIGVEEGAPDVTTFFEARLEEIAYSATLFPGKAIANTYDIYVSNLSSIRRRRAAFLRGEKLRAPVISNQLV